MKDKIIAELDKAFAVGYQGWVNNDYGLGRARGFQEAKELVARLLERERTEALLGASAVITLGDLCRLPPGKAGPYDAYIDAPNRRKLVYFKTADEARRFAQAYNCNAVRVTLTDLDSCYVAILPYNPEKP